MARRASGILLHPTSLPGLFGIGDLGEGAHAFLKWLQEAGQSIWQMLPLVPAGPSHSPYDGASAFAGNPLLISPHDLVEHGFLHPTDLERVPVFDDRRVDYGGVGAWKAGLLRTAWHRFQEGATTRQRDELEEWVHRPEQDSWLDDWALFISLKARFDGKPWSDWPADLRSREPDSLSAARQELEDEIGYRCFVQYLFTIQWSRLKEAAARRQIELLGDMPFYVAHDSADVWARRHLFKVTADGQPICVAGVPPDYFSETGQRWGNPVFSWDQHQEDGYRWWTQRVGHSLRLYDRVRIDHFRAFAAYWEIDAQQPTATHGHWAPGPGADLFAKLRTNLGSLPLVAEDLGHITPDVRELRQRLGLPGMKVVQFGFDAHDSEHLPHNFDRDIVAYTGTHDNDTAVGWLGKLDADRRQAVLDYIGGDGSESHWDLIRCTLNSHADRAILPIQDVLGLDSRHRMNTPGSSQGNWEWRLQPGAADTPTALRLRRLTTLSGRREADSEEPAP